MADPLITTRCNERRSVGGPAAALAAVALLATSTIPAAETVITPSIDVGGLYETNPTLNPAAEEEVLGLAADARVDLRYRTQKLDASLRPRAFLTYYPDDADKDLEADDYYLPATLSYVTPRSRSGLSVAYSDVSVRRSELESADGSTPGGSASLNFITDRQTRLSVDPSWSYLVTPRTNFRLEAGYSDIKYDNTFVQNNFARFDYTYLYGSVSLDRSLTEKAALGLAFNGSQFESEEPTSGVQNDSQTYGTNLFLNYQFGQSLSGAISLGGRDTQSTVSRRPAFNIPGLGDVCVDLIGFLVPCSQEFDGNTYVGEITLRKEGQRTNFDFSLGRDIAPNSQGTETTRNTLRATLARQLTEKLRVNAGLLYFNQTDAAEVTSRDRDYASADITLRWRFTRQWSLRGTYRYVWIKDITSITGDSLNVKADNNYLFFGIGWQGLGWRR